MRRFTFDNCFMFPALGAMCLLVAGCGGGSNSNNSSGTGTGSTMTTAGDNTSDLEIPSQAEADERAAEDITQENADEAFRQLQEELEREASGGGG